MSDLINEGKKTYREAFWLGLAADEKISVSDWSDKHRILSNIGAAEPGPWRTSRTPYLKDIMDALSPSSPIEEIVVKKGAQIGYTEALVNFLGYLIDVTGGPALLVQPTLDLAKRFSKQRIDPLVEFCEKIKGKIKDPRSRDSGNTVLMKEFLNGMIVLTGANSAVGLRSMPARYLLMDEVDAYPDDADGEGDPMMLATARTRTFSRRKIVKGGTPTFEGRSKVDAAFMNTDQRYWYVPCPYCNFFQKIEWERIKWPKGKPDEAKLECISCNKLIDEYQKEWMLPRGKFIAENLKHDNPKVIGFHISSLYSPFGWYHWSEAAKEYLQAQRSPELLRSFINTVLGECWREKGEAPDWKRLYERREKYEIGTVPQGGCFLTAGADVQKDRIEVEIVAWGRGKESWSVDYRVFQGDTGVPDSGAWLQLDALMNEHFLHESGVNLPIAMLCVDSGYQSNTVYNWCRKYPMSRVRATKGSDAAVVVLGNSSSVDVTIRGNKMRKGFKVWTIGVSLAKNELYAWLGMDKPLDLEPYPPAYCHFPEYSEEFFKQLTAESLMTKKVKGKTKFHWEKIRDRNEALDCRILARVGSMALGIERIKEDDWVVMLDSLRKKVPEFRQKNEETTATGEQPSVKNSVVRRKSDWLDGY
jgi:phage terminase large subunit GpA-like protein